MNELAPFESFLKELIAAYRTKYAVQFNKNFPVENSDALNGPATITVTFEAYGAHGVRLLTDEPRPTQTKQM
ncbi:hypothetical protein [Acinetobacter baumannii]|uniref:hypothetical protein n=1 Tax=Acinetobacter baumannii TaxID=470 RepID=UPI002B22ACD8|nr:hypothetical protein [Acinetobacter baumannii]